MTTLVRSIIDRVSPKAAVTTVSRTPGTLRGAIPMIGTRGMHRWATYRLIYKTNPWVYAAVTKLSRDFARLPIHTTQIDGAGKKTRLRGDIPATPGAQRFGGQSLDRLMLQPDPRLSRFACWNGTGVDRFTNGNALWEIERAGSGGAPASFRRHSWRTVTDVRESGGEVLYYEIDESTGGLGGRRRRLGPEEVVHFGRGTDPETCIGVSPLEACHYTLALYEGVVRHLIAYFANQARPSGHIGVEGLTADMASLIRELIEEAYSSPENAGKVLVTAGKWESTADTPDNARVIELIRLSREEVAAVYGVPPPTIGILEQAIKSNVKELREQYTREGLGPWVTEFEDELAAQVIPLSPSWRFCSVRFQLNEMLRPDLEARAKVYKDMKDVLTTDDKRSMEGLDPFEIPGVTDVPWVDSGSLPMTRAAEQMPGAAGFSNPGSDDPEEDPTDDAEPDDEEDED